MISEQMTCAEGRMVRESSYCERQQHAFVHDLPEVSDRQNRAERNIEDAVYDPAEQNQELHEA